MQAIADHAKKSGHISSITKLDWLRKCLAERSLLPVDKTLKMSSSTLAASMAEHKAASAMAAVTTIPAKPQVDPGSCFASIPLSSKIPGETLCCKAEVLRQRGESVMAWSLEWRLMIESLRLLMLPTFA